MLDAGTRPPQRLYADVVQAFRTRRGLAVGIARFVFGFAAIVIGAYTIAPLNAVLPYFFAMTLSAALVIEQLIGPDVRARFFTG